MKKRPRLIPFEELKADFMKDPKFRLEYEKLQPELEVARQMMNARRAQDISQKELAEKVGTGQAVISRLEGMNAHPSISLLQRVARALGIKFKITIG